MVYKGFATKGYPSFLYFKSVRLVDQPDYFWTVYQFFSKNLWLFNYDPTYKSWHPKDNAKKHEKGLVS